MDTSRVAARRRALARLSTLVLLLGAVALATLVFVPIDRGSLQRFVDGFGPFAVPVFVVVAAVLALVFFPGPVLSAVSGVLFGVWLGFAASLASAVLTAVLGLLVARRAGGSSLADLSGPRALALADLARRQGLGVVVLQRLVPGLPDAPFSYLFGLLRLRVWEVALGTVVGSAPRAFAYTALGDSAASRDGGLAAWALGVLVAVSVVGAVAGAVVVRRHRRASAG
ncbi:TVP38/TMEM64 family protein [Jatrophihabitans sp. YIM 134969]